MRRKLYGRLCEGSWTSHWNHCPCWVFDGGRWSPGSNCNMLYFENCRTADSVFFGWLKLATCLECVMKSLPCTKVGNSSAKRSSDSMPTSPFTWSSRTSRALVGALSCRRRLRFRWCGIVVCSVMVIMVHLVRELAVKCANYENMVKAQETKVDAQGYNPSQHLDERVICPTWGVVSSPRGCGCFVQFVLETQNSGTRQPKSKPTEALWGYGTRLEKDIDHVIHQFVRL
jgi:hypothetical protein